MLSLFVYFIAILIAVVAKAAPLNTSAGCGAFPIIINMPKHFAFLSGGNLFEVLFLAENVPAVCRMISIDFHLYYFNGTTSTGSSANGDNETPTKKFVTNCRPSPLGQDFRVYCEAPNIARILADEGLPVQSVLNASSIVFVEPYAQLNGCKRPLNSRQPRFCFAFVVQPEGRYAIFLPASSAASTFYLLQAQTIRYYPDPIPTDAVINFGTQRVIISGAQLGGDIMAKFYSITITIAGRNISCSVITNETTNNMLTCSFSVSDIPSFDTSFSTTITTQITVGNLAISLPTSIGAIAKPAANVMIDEFVPPLPKRAPLLTDTYI